jgi:phospholipid/cholesterol/gamma-HCH transport system substrate-binding protein
MSRAKGIARGIEFRVGLLIVAAVAVFAIFVFLLGNFSLSSGFTFYVDYQFSGNIRPGAPVKVSGIAVGTVEEVEFIGGRLDPETGRRPQVRLEVWVEDRAQDSIRADAEFFINTAGVLGEQYLEIVGGRDWDRPPIEPGAVMVGVDPPRTDLVVARLYEVLDSLSLVLKNNKTAIADLINNGAGAIGEVNTILRDNRAEVGELIASTNQMFGSASTTLDKVNEGLSDPRVVQRTLADADRLVVTAEKTLGELGPPARELLADGRRVTGLITDERLERALKLADGAVGVTGKASALLDNVDGMVDDLRAGKGTAGALLAREEIYADLREMIRDLKRNPWKFFWKE